MLLKDIKTIKSGDIDITKIMHNNKVIWSENVYMAKDSDFVDINGSWIYKGSELEVEIPEYIKGKFVTSCLHMFSGYSTYNATPVTKVVLRHDRVLSTANMFNSSSATTLDLSSFNTNNVYNMYAMFYNSSATTLDLSSFNTIRASDMSNMFNGSRATIGYARTQADADKFNASLGKPSGLKFVVK